jgi:UDP-glucose 4-epimerase
VADLCSGIAAALGAPLKGGEVFHLASGRETTVRELAELLRKIAGRPDHPIEHRPARAGEVARNFASYALAAESLGFTPKHSLEQGLADTWQWFNDNRDVALGAATSDS